MGPILLLQIELKELKARFRAATDPGFFYRGKCKKKLIRDSIVFFQRNTVFLTFLARYHCRPVADNLQHLVLLSFSFPTMHHHP